MLAIEGVGSTYAAHHGVSACATLLTPTDHAKVNPICWDGADWTNCAAGSDETYFCASTLPNQFASVQTPNSRCMRVPPPPPLPDGSRGFVPAVRLWFVTFTMHAVRCVMYID